MFFLFVYLLKSIIFVLIDENVNIEFAIDTLEELDWCLVQLENMQSLKTISDLASTKVYFIFFLYRNETIVFF